MATVMRDKVLNLASRQVGYKETGTNNTKYARFFDNEAWQWFNTKKQGAEWCAIFICWLFAQNEIIGKQKARLFLGCPTPPNNCAAGVPYLWQYLKARKWQVDKKAGLPGDIIFFNAKCTHVGIIEKVDEKKYYTIEGNKNNQVKRCSYTRGSSSVYGLMRPAWSEIEPKEDPKPVEPAPVVVEPPKPVAPVYPKYKVKTVTGEWLALRVAPNTKAVLIVRMDYGATVDLVKTVSGEKIYGSTEWAYVNYTKNGRTYQGYCIKSRLKKS